MTLADNTRPSCRTQYDIRAGDGKVVAWISTWYPRHSSAAIVVPIGANSLPAFSLTEPFQAVRYIQRLRESGFLIKRRSRTVDVKFLWNRKTKRLIRSSHSGAFENPLGRQVA